MNKHHHKYLYNFRYKSHYKLPNNHIENLIPQL